MQVGKQKIHAYIADDDAKRQQGLMFVEKLPDNTGMLFVFEDVQPLGFWMKNTLIPLNIGFFDGKGVLIDAQEMKVAESLMKLNPPTYQSRAPAQFALEMPQGWFKKHGVSEGAKLRTFGDPPSALLKKLLPPGK
jgi:uncharacterized membrane protein (UPF0127 family)